jgi:pimeloyl-ACP methyl ester carboxylesterase
MTRRMVLVGVALLLVPLAGLRAEPERGPAPPVDAAFQKFWEAHNPGDAAKAAQDVVRSGVSFEDAYQRLKRGRSYAVQSKRGVVHLLRRTATGEFAYDVYLPEDYDPGRSYQLRFQLHGGVMMREQPTSDSVAPSAGRGGRRAASPLLGDEQIYVMPSAWRDAPWWSSAQVENLEFEVDSLKRTYNIDENRVVLSGVSDGATGAYFVAMRDTTPYASFLPLNGSLMVLASDRIDVGGELFPTNLINKPFFIVNGGADPLYPVRGVEPYVQHLKRSGVRLEFHPQPDAGHNTAWWPEVRETFERFVREHPRDPFPARLSWEVTDRQLPGRAHWLVIDRLQPSSAMPRLEPDANVFSGEGSNQGRLLFARQRPSGRVDLERTGNSVRVRAGGVSEFTLLLSPDAFDFNEPVTVVVNGRMAVETRVERSVATLLKWAARDNDRTMLFGAELHVPVAR